MSSYNDGPVLHAAIQPLLADPATGEVIVVLDGSDDGSYESLLPLAERDPRLRPFQIAQRGRSGAREFGVEQSRFDVLLLLDSDVIGVGPLVTGHAGHHRDGRPRLVLGYMPVRASRKRPGSFVSEHYARMYETRCLEYEHDPNEIFRGLWGGNMSLPKRSVEAAGGFDGGLGIDYNEDLELGLRLAEAGLEPVFDRHLLAEHRFERSVSGFMKTGRQYGQAAVLIEARHPGSVAFPPAPQRGWAVSVRALTRSRRLHDVFVTLATSVVVWAGRIGRHQAERRLGELLERVEVQVGIREARAALRDGRALVLVR
jgi:cellulose synthase/poly-beta-1,6-N-acetylglucosamine synthase-like glycosyltransferase